MPQHPKPFFRSGRGWYVQLGKQQIKLGDGPKNSQTEAAAWERYHEVMAENSLPPTEQPAAKSAGLTVAEVFEKYLDWCQKHRAGRTFDWYRDHLQDFLTRNSKLAHLPAADLRPFHVIEWADSHGDSWSPAYRRGGIVALQRPFNWAEELGYIPASPIKRIKKPQPQRRDNPITPEDFAAMIVRYAEGDPFRDLLTFAWFSGCRPQEAKHIEPRHVNLAEAVVVLPKEEAKGKKRPRVIHLHGEALAIITRLMAEKKQGKLFLNEDGKPWKRFAVANRFQRLMIAFGMEKLKAEGVHFDPLPRFNRRNYPDKASLAKARKEHQQKLTERRKEIVKLARKQGRGFAMYDLRHGFATRKLVQGVNPITLAELMGHRDGTMVATVYQHLDRNHEHLKKALEEE